MGAAESRETNDTSGSSSNPRRKPDDDSGISKSLAVAGAVGAAVGAGILAWNATRSAAADSCSAYGQGGSYRGPNDGAKPQLTQGGAKPVYGEEEEEEEEEYMENYSGSSKVITWSPPPNDHWMLNTDGSHTPGVRGGAGGIIRDHNGGPIIAFACAFPPNDILVHELQAICEGLKLAQRQKLVQKSPLGIIVATDCDSAARLLDSVNPFVKFPRNPGVRTVVEEIAKVRGSLGFPSVVKHVSKESNRVADHLSRACKENAGYSIMSPDELPGRVRDLVDEDAKNPSK